MSDNIEIFPPGICFEKSEQHIHLSFGKVYNTLSNAVFNGGFQAARHIVNLKVGKDAGCTERPELTLNRYRSQQGWLGLTIGMMTAASMNSVRIKQRQIEGYTVMALVTTGLSNARRAGDPAEWRTLMPNSYEHDTINIILLSSLGFKPAAMVEGIMIVTEAKAVALQNAGIKSPVSNAIATGTGTDAIIMASPRDEVFCIDYCGKHTLMGETIAQLVIDAITDSIDWELSNFGA